MWCAFENDRRLGSKAEERDAKRMCREHARQLVGDEITKRFPVQTLVEAEGSASTPDAKRYAIVRESAAYTVYRIQPDPGWIYNSARLEPYMRFSWKCVQTDLEEDVALVVKSVPKPLPPKPLPKFDWVTLHKADNVLVLGGRGCGKTTLLRKILAEKIQPDQELHICSTDLDEFEDFQSYGAHFYGSFALNGPLNANSLTLMDNVRFPQHGGGLLSTMLHGDRGVILGTQSLHDLPLIRSQMGLIFVFDMNFAEIENLYDTIRWFHNPVPREDFFSQIRGLPEHTFMVIDCVSHKDRVTLWAANAFE